MAAERNVSAKSRDRRRAVPAVGRALGSEAFRPLLQVYGEELVGVHLRHELSSLRQELEAAEEAETGLEDLARRVEVRLLAQLGPPLRRVLNATGIMIHTNLGRAPLPSVVADELPPLLDASCDLEVDLESGERGDRNERVARLVTAIVPGAQAAVAVNNNAAALVLALQALARGREVLLSRGEMVEIGGSFRIPDILEAAGARLVEVGTTNRTRIADYRQALTERTALLLKIHPSNFRIAGFTEEATLDELVALARESGVPLLVDEGSGVLTPHPAPQLASRPSVQECLEAGADLVCSSADKVLGGPQAGLLVGERSLVDVCRRHPLYRAFRPSRLTLLALERLLRHRLAGGDLPLDRLWLPRAELEARLRPFLQTLPSARIVEGDAFVGGGAAPDEPIPGPVLSVPGGVALQQRLRRGEPAVWCYARGREARLDLRTIAAADERALLEVLRAELLGAAD